MRHVLGVILLLVVGSANAATLYFSQDSNSSGLYTIDINTGVATHLGETGTGGMTVGLAPSNNPEFLYGSTPSSLARINTDGSGATIVGYIVAEGLAFDPGSNTLYGQLNDSFFTIDTNTGAKLTTLANAPGDPDGLTWGDGGVFGVSDDNDSLIYYDVGLDSWSTIGSLGISINNPGLAYNVETDTLYTMGSAGDLYSVDAGTGLATFVGSTGLAGGGGLAFAAVPIPAAAYLFASGLGLLGWFRRRQTA